MKIVIAPDSFKGSLSAWEASLAIEQGVKKVLPEADVVLVPVADGGEGTMDRLVAATNGKKVEAMVNRTSPSPRKGCLRNSGGWANLRHRNGQCIRPLLSSPAAKRPDGHHDVWHRGIDQESPGCWLQKIHFSHMRKRYQ